MMLQLTSREPKIGDKVYQLINGKPNKADEGIIQETELMECGNYSLQIVWAVQGKKFPKSKWYISSDEVVFAE